MGNNEFKIFLGLELDKNASSTFSQELKKLTSNDIKVKVGLDESSLKTLTTAINGITEQLKQMSVLSTKAGKDIEQGMQKATKSLTPFADNIKKVTAEYKKGLISAKEYSDRMSKALMINDERGLSSFYANQFSNQEELQEYIDLVTKVKETVRTINPIGDLVKTSEFSVVKNESAELVKQVNVYSDKMGKVQTITSLVNKETGELVATQQRLVDNSGNYAEKLAKQKATMEQLGKASEQANSYAIDLIKSGNSSNSDNEIKLINNANQLKKAYKEINELSSQGVIVEQSKINYVKSLVKESQTLKSLKDNELEQARQLQIAQQKQLVDTQKMMATFNSTNTKYSTGVTDVDKQAMQDMITALSQLNPKQDDYTVKVKECNNALSAYCAKVKESASYAQKQQVETDNQTVAILKLNNALKNTNSKYSTGVSTKDSENIQSMIDSLSKMNPMTQEYKNQLKLVGVALGEYTKKSRESASQIQKEEVALNNQINTLEKFKNKLNNIKNSTKGSYDKQQANNFSQEIEAIGRLNPLTEEYRSRVQALGTAMTQFGVESRNAFSQAKGQLSAYEVGFERLITLYKTGSIPTEQFLKSAQSIRYTTTSTGELIEKQEFLNLSSQKQIQLTNLVAQAQGKVQKANDQTKKSQQDLILYQEKMMANLSQLYQAYSNKNMNTNAIVDLMNKVKALSTNTEDLKFKQRQLNEEYRQLGIASKSVGNLGTSLKNIIQLATGFYGVQSIFMYMRQAISSMVTEVTSLDDAMIGLSRVTSETDATYQSFKKTMFGVANEIGGSAKELVDSATEFAKLGYSFEEAGKLAESASKYATVGWLEMGEATDALSASYTVFGGQFDKAIGKIVDSTSIIDLYNKIGKTYVLPNCIVICNDRCV